MLSYFLILSLNEVHLSINLTGIPALNPHCICSYELVNCFLLNMITLSSVSLINEEILIILACVF